MLIKLSIILIILIISYLFEYQIGKLAMTGFKESGLNREEIHS